MKKNSILEQALLQAKALEEAVKTNAKGILHSTMKEEIDQLVKESLEKEVSEQDADDADDDADQTDDISTDTDSDSDSEQDVPSSIGSSDDDDDSEEDSDSDKDDSDSAIPSGYRLAGADDEDSDDDDSIGATDDSDEDSDDTFDLTGADDDEIVQIFKKMKDDDGIVVTQDGDDVQLNVDGQEFLIKLHEDDEEGEMCEDDEEKESESDLEESDEPIYEITFDDDDFADDDMGLGDDHDITPDDIHISDDADLGSDDDLNFDGSGLNGMDDELDGEDPSLSHSFSDDDMGSDDHNHISLDQDELAEEDDMETEPEAEVKETARTLGMGNRKGALHKGSRVSATLQKEHTELKKQVKILRERNDEYKKALSVFRDKLQEVAVFNANLAYATRLFTEHATTKQEKVQILKRFDSADTLKESQGLYNTIKGELKNKTVVNESVVEKITKTPTKGSTEILAESKAYQNPQFSRMKELIDRMTKK